jgi:hypothetical protein
MPNPKRGAHPEEVIDQSQNPKPSPIEELIVHPIHGPTVIGCNSRRASATIAFFIPRRLASLAAQGGQRLISYFNIERGNP